MNDDLEIEPARRTIDSGELACRNLLCAVISTAIEDIGPRRVGKAGMRLAGQAREWIESGDSSFRDLCGILGLNASRIRSETLSWCSGQVRAHVPDGKQIQ